MVAGSAEMGGSGDRDCEDGAHYDHPKEEAEVQVDVTRGLSACQWRVRDWMGTTTEDHGCGREGGRHPSARASTDCAGSHQQSLVEADLLGKAVGRWDGLGRWYWVEAGGVGWNRRCADHLWAGRGWRYCLGEVEEDRLGRAVVQRCWHKQLDAHPGDLVLREAGHLLLAPASTAPTAE